MIQLLLFLLQLNNFFAFTALNCFVSYEKIQLRILTDDYENYEQYSI